MQIVNSLNLKRVAELEYMKGDQYASDTKTITLAHGQGMTEMECQFYFNKDGKCIWHRVVE